MLSGAQASHIYSQLLHHQALSLSRQKLIFSFSNPNIFKTFNLLGLSRLGSAGAHEPAPLH